MDASINRTEVIKQQVDGTVQRALVVNTPAAQALRQTAARNQSSLRYTGSYLSTTKAGLFTLGDGMGV